MKDNKKGQGGNPLTNLVIGMSLAGLIILVFVILPNNNSFGFWAKQGYTLPSNELEQLDFSTNMSNLVVQLNNDILRENATSLKDGTIVGNIFGGGYSAIVTIMKSLGFSKVFIFSAGGFLQIDPVVSNILVGILTITIVIFILFLIFNRVVS